MHTVNQNFSSGPKTDYDTGIQFCTNIDFEDPNKNEYVHENHLKRETS